MIATEQYFAVMLFTTRLYKVVLTFELVDKILQLYHSNERHWAVLSCDPVEYICNTKFIKLLSVSVHVDDGIILIDELTFFV